MMISLSVWGFFFFMSVFPACRRTDAFSAVAVNTGQSSWTVPARDTLPPFPDGLCGGTLVPLPAETLYSTDVKSSGGNSLVLPVRGISVWLPPGYDDDDDDSPKQQQQRYPVLYCHDGENAILDSSSWTGQSWRLTGALTRLHENGKIPVLPIVVLLPSAPGDFMRLPGVRRRHLEYGDNGPWSQAHASFIALTLKPYIDHRFRTRPSCQDTFAMGTSLGGQASLQLLLHYPDVFGGAACLSPAFGPSTLAAVASENHPLSGKRLYLDMGGDMEETKVPWLDLLDHLPNFDKDSNNSWWNPGYWWLDTQLQPTLQMLRSSLKSQGIPHMFRADPGARHNERAWSQRIHWPLLYLYSNNNNNDNEQRE